VEKFVFSSTLAKKPVFNHTNKTITVSDKFFSAAKDPTNDEFYDLMKLRELCPGYEIITRSHRKPRRTENTPRIPKFVSYEHMEKYIALLPDSEKLLAELKLVKNYAKAHNYAASIVFKWFNEKFPDYHKKPKIDENGKLVATVNVVNFEDLKKKADAAKAEAEPPQADPQDTEGTNELQKVV
jgi:hypothetical protein